MTDEIRDLQERIKQAQHEGHGGLLPADNPHEQENLNTGLRAGAEMVGGVIGGLMMGWGVDSMFDTRPFGLVIGLLLGVVAGFYGVYVRTK